MFNKDKFIFFCSQPYNIAYSYDSLTKLQYTRLYIVVGGMLVLEVVTIPNITPVVPPINPPQ